MMLNYPYCVNIPVNITKYLHKTKRGRKPSQRFFRWRVLGALGSKRQRTSNECCSRWSEAVIMARWGKSVCHSRNLPSDESALEGEWQAERKAPGKGRERWKVFYHSSASSILSAYLNFTIINYIKISFFNASVYAPPPTIRARALILALVLVVIRFRRVRDSITNNRCMAGKLDLFLISACFVIISPPFPPPSFLDIHRQRRRRSQQAFESNLFIYSSRAKALGTRWGFFVYNARTRLPSTVIPAARDDN